jgi:putative ABC transport system ATP-binding protein
MLEIKDISHSYGKEKILHHVSFSVLPKSFTVLTGVSGSGKTTLLSIIATLLQPTEGEVIFHDLPACSLDVMRSKYIGFIFQFHYLIGHLTVMENIKMMTDKSKDDIIALLATLGVEKFAHSYPSALSGGQRQRVAVARALINDPKYIFADEPTGNLDSENSRMIFDILRQVNATVLVVTHDHTLLQKSDRIFTLKDGRLC